jgi:molybdopterin converting factor subunit 1
LKIKIILFASAREIVGREKVEMEFKEGVRLSDCKAALLNTFPSMGKIIEKCRYAVNMDIKNDEYILNEGDEVAVLPPVSGGDG